jgi:hypothetical protein
MLFMVGLRDQRGVGRTLVSRLTHEKVQVQMKYYGVGRWKKFDLQQRFGEVKRWSSGSKSMEWVND